MTSFEFHTAAQQFPLLDSERIEELIEDIRQHGQREAIRVLDGKIVDGRNRYLACQRIGVEPHIEHLDDDIDPFAYVWSLNGERRDLTQDQRYLIWKSCAQKSGQWDQMRQKLQKRANQSRSELLKGRPRSCTPSTSCGRDTEKPRGQGSALRAAASKTNRGAVERMDRLQRVRPDLAEKVREGTLSSAEAMREINPDISPHIANNTGDNEWYTPKQYIQLARQVMGGIDLDPASCEAANKVVQAANFYDEDEDGLIQDWQGRVFMNPPYSQPQIQRFCEKLARHVSSGEVSEAVVLVNNATETRWGQMLLSLAAAVCFPAGRVKFWHPEKVSAPLQGQMILYFGSEREKFTHLFKEEGVICHGR